MIRTENVNLTSAGNFAWTIAITDKSLTLSAKYVLRFKISGQTYNPNTGELSSPGILVLRAAAPTTTTSSSSTPPVTISSFSTSSSSSSSLSTTQSSQTSTISSPAPQTSISLPTHSTGQLSGGAKAGIGIGAAVLAVVIASLIFFFMRGRKKKSTPAEASGTQSDYKEWSQGTVAHPVELPGAWTEGITELPARR